MSEELERIKAVYRRRIDLGLSKRYSLFLPGELYTLQRREQSILRLLARAQITDLAALRVLEVGCGRGRTLADWTRWGGSARNLHGIDLMEPFIRQASEILPRSALLVGSADRLPFPDHSFDIVAQLTMFTSILDAAARLACAAEMRRVLAPAGAILWYDFRYPSPRNRDVRPVRLRDIRALFPGWSVDVVATTLLPPIARRLAPISFWICGLLESALPPLRSHYLAVIRRPGL
jgi:ubiquinone/menaquinone biosynthesis C-methylase UbiE